MKILGALLGLVFALIIAAYVAAFTDFGNGLVRPYAQNLIKEKSGFDVKFDKFQIRPMSIDIVANINDEIAANVNGGLSIFSQSLNLKYDKKVIGFGAEVQKQDSMGTEGEFFKKVLPEDLMKQGIIPELVGRLPVITTLDNLDEQTLINILTKPKNAIVKQYQKLCKLEGVKLEFTQEALTEIAKRALKRKMGARGLRAIIEHTMLDIMFELPSSNNIKEITITKDTIDNYKKAEIEYK